MRLYTKILIAFLTWCISAQAWAQNSDQTLLWRVSGKGSKPSYLFGTFHLNDKRLFHFDDSVYAALEATEGFANELDLNEMAVYYINKAVDEAINGKMLKDVLSEKEIEAMKKPLEKKFNKSFDDISTSDVAKEKNKWMTDAFKKGEMPTFVDAYLFDVARRRGKWIGGIEDLEDQLSLVDKSDINLVVAGSETGMLEKMIKMYERQDLRGINNFVNHTDSASRDAILIHRNIKMARRMDSLMQQRTMFFAIGAAHLPGDSGVINLLRKRGFTVSPVHSDRRIFSDDYKFTGVPVTWMETTDGAGLYRVSMPAKPSTVKIFGVVEMKVMLEFSNLSGFCTTAVVLPSGNDESSDSLFARFAEKIFKNKKPKPQRVVKGVDTGAEYIEEQNDYWTRMQLFHKQNVLYMAAIYGSKREHLKTPDAERFMKSMVLTPGKPVETKVYSYTDTLACISYSSPVKITRNEALTKQYQKNNEWDARAYTGQDAATGAFFVVVTKQTNAGNAISNDSVAQTEVADLIKSKYKLKQTWGTLDGYRSLNMEGDTYESDIHTKMVSFVRGNKYAAVMLVTGKKTEDSSLLTIFTTLHSIPYKKVIWQQCSDSAHTFNATVPAPFATYPLDKFKKNRQGIGAVLIPSPP